VGWLAEGVLVHTVVEDLPLSISFTGLAWHALISVLVGWYLLGTALRRGDRRRVVLISAGLGAFWGVWAIWWWVDPGRVATPSAFAAHALLTSVPLVASYVIHDHLGRGGFHPTRRTQVVVGAIFLLLYAATVATSPLSAVVVPALIGLALVGLRRNRRGMSVPDWEPATGVEHSPGWWSYVPMLLIPGFAMAIYALAFELSLRVPTGWVVYAVTTTAGFWFFVQAFRRSTRAASESEELVAL